MCNNQTNHFRVRWFRVYLFLGILFLIISLLSKEVGGVIALLWENRHAVSWSLAWAFIGMALGLWNSRTNIEAHLLNNRHYYAYFLFVLTLASLSAFLAYLNFADSLLKSHISSLITAMVVGFAGDALAGVINKQIKFN